MLFVKRLPVVAAAAGLAVLAGCGVISTGHTAGQPGAPAVSAQGGGSVSADSTMSPAATAAVPAATGQAQSAATSACRQPGTYLTAIRTGEQAGFDRVVFQFAGKMPAYNVSVAKAVYTDPKGDKVPLAGQVLLRVVFHGATALCPPAGSKTYAGPSTLAPFCPRVLEVAEAGDFEQVLSFGVGLAAKGSYRVYSLAGPNRVVLDVSHVGLTRFPGIWDITSWRLYWESQYSWLNGRQPWLGNPAMVVQAWARSRWPAGPAIRQVNANTFSVTEPGGRTDTVTGTRPAPVPGPWVITKITYGTPRA